MSRNGYICLLEMTIQTFVSSSWIIYLYLSFRSCNGPLVVPSFLSKDVTESSTLGLVILLVNDNIFMRQ